MTLNLKVEIKQISGHREKTLLSFECESSDQAITEINRWLLKKFPEVYEKLYGGSG